MWYSSGAPSGLSRPRGVVGSGHQVYVVCPRIGDDEETAAKGKKAKKPAVEDGDGEEPPPDESGEQRRPPLAVLDVAEQLGAGPLAGLFQSLAGSSMGPFVDRLVPIGLVLVGLSLVLGLLTQAGCWGALGFLTLFYASSIPMSGVDMTLTQASRAPGVFANTDAAVSSKACLNSSRSSRRSTTVSMIGGRGGGLVALARMLRIIIGARRRRPNTVLQSLCCMRTPRSVSSTRSG